MNLSIITLYYNTLGYTLELARILEPQLTNEVEWLIIDNGCNEKELDKIKKAKIIHLEQDSGGPSVPRNVGIDMARSEYITFIDSDDFVTDDYVETILNKIKTSDFDYCYFGWKSPHFTVYIEEEPPEWNRSIWNCIYTKNMIGDERFKPDLHCAEDWDFNQRARHGKRENIDKIIYYYNDNPDSLSKRIARGEK